MRLTALLAYNAAGEVVATLDYMVARDDAGEVVGLLDFEAQELTGELTDVWSVVGAAGSGTWPEWLGVRAHDFTVERANGRISALVHRQSGHRRERITIEAAIAQGEPAGGPDRPLLLDDEGRTVARVPVQRPKLPIIGITG